MNNDPTQMIFSINDKGEMVRAEPQWYLDQQTENEVSELRETIFFLLGKIRIMEQRMKMQSDQINRLEKVGRFQMELGRQHNGIIESIRTEIKRIWDLFKWNKN